MVQTLKDFLYNYSYVIIIILTIIAAVFVIKYVVTHVPSGGKITELYDRDGNRNEKKPPKKVSIFALILGIVLVLAILYMNFFVL